MLRVLAFIGNATVWLSAIAFWLILALWFWLWIENHYYHSSPWFY